MPTLLSASAYQHAAPPPPDTMEPLQSQKNPTFLTPPFGDPVTVPPVTPFISPQIIRAALHHGPALSTFPTFSSDMYVHTTVWTDMQTHMKQTSSCMIIKGHHKPFDGGRMFLTPILVNHK